MPIHSINKGFILLCRPAHNFQFFKPSSSGTAYIAFILPDCKMPSSKQIRQSCIIYLLKNINKKTGCHFGQPVFFKPYLFTGYKILVNGYFLTILSV